jgi:hypothetical protein
MKVDSIPHVRFKYIRPVTQCPFCKSTADFTLVRCSSCRTQYHQECWKENHGCSVYGCEGMMIKLRGFALSIPFLGFHLRLFQDPKWLMFLRFLVFGFYPCFALLRTEDFSFSLTDLFFLAWGLISVFGTLPLFIIELACWWIVYEDPSLQERFGREMNHIISIAIYGSAVWFVILSLFV